MIVRPETPSDEAYVYAINVAAFETDAEARLVNALRTQCDEYISLVAESEDGIVGHILFTPVSLGDGEARVAGLAPMAVRQDLQRSGIGSMLVNAGLVECERKGFGAVVVLGHPDYYPKFGFEPASQFGLSSEYDVPDEVFMARNLKAGFLDDLSGVFRYHAAFAAV